MRVLKCMSEVGYVLCIVTGYIFSLQYCCSESCPQRGVIRLQNGTNNFEGRVEVCGNRNATNHTLIWKTVCNAGWDRNEAIVVCRQLGFSGNFNPIPVTNGTFSDHSLRHYHIDYIIKKNFTCRGDEETLLNCTYYNRNVIYCNDPLSRMKPAGVYCFGQDHEQNPCNDGEIRLINGTYNVSGRVEVCLGRLWGTVCDDGWTTKDSNTVCRQLGYLNHKRAIPTREAYFGEGSGPIHLSMARCSDHNTRLIDCTINKTGINKCDHIEDAGVICMGPNNCGDSDVRLVGGQNEREGRVEICYNRVWGTVCDYGWDEVDANVVCRQLGFSYQRALSTNDSRFGDGKGPILLENVKCSDGHSTLSQCVDSMFTGALGHCEHTAGVICMGEDTTMNTSTGQVPATSSHGTTTYMSYDSIYTFYDTTSTTSVGFGSSISLIIYGTIPGALVIIGVIASVAIVIVVVAMRKRARKTENSNCGPSVKSSMDNPTYDENISITPTATRRIISDEDDEERVFKNPIYSDVGQSLSNDPNPHHPYEDIKMDTLVSTSHENAHSQGALGNEGLQNSNEVRDIVDDGCYSALHHSTEYSTLDHHILKPYQEQLQPSTDDYSQLHAL